MESPDTLVFVTTPERARTFSEATAPGFHGEALDGYGNIHFEVLWAQLCGDTYDEEKHAFEQLVPPLSLFRFPDDFVRRVAALGPSEITLAANAWLEDDVVCSIDATEAERVIAILVALSRSVSDGRAMYLWFASNEP